MQVAPLVPAVCQSSPTEAILRTERSDATNHQGHRGIATERSDADILSERSVA